jgi:hypothetical protein
MNELTEEKIEEILLEEAMERYYEKKAEHDK